jgi:serine/threonine protein kinase
MVTRDGLVKILDFGIVKLLGVTGPTQTGSTLGTVSYMSPEQIDGEDADPRSDVWALGAVLYEMLTGQLPFKGESQWVVMNAISTRDPGAPRVIRPEVPEGLDATVMRALEKDPAQRTGSADEFRQQLEACRPSEAGAVPAGSVAPSPWQSLRRPVVALPAVAIVLLLALWSISSASQGAEERQAREETLPRVLALLEQNENAAALELVRGLEEIIPNDPVLAEATAAASAARRDRNAPLRGCSTIPIERLAWSPTPTTSVASTSIRSYTAFLRA